MLGVSNHPGRVCSSEDRPEARGEMGLGRPARTEEGEQWAQGGRRGCRADGTMCPQDLWGR